MLEWLAVLCVLCSIWALSEKLYRWGWGMNLLACALWSMFAFDVSAWALLAQQGLIAVMAVRGLYNSW
jgi:hypothetical protein